MAFPYLTHDTFCLTLAHSIDDIDLVEQLLQEYPQDTEACMASALQHALESKKLPPMPALSSERLLTYLTVLWRDEGLNGKLIETARYDLTYLLPYLIVRGADIHHGDDIAIDMFAGHDNIAAVEILLSNRANIHVRDDSPLMSAASHASTDMIKLLLQQGADLHAREDKGGALYYAAGDGNDEVVKLLIDLGLNVNSEDVLAAAAHDGHNSTVELLLDRRADIEMYGASALADAIEEDHLDTATILLNAGAAVVGGRALISAAKHGQTDAVKLLLQHRVNVHAKDDKALMRAISYCHHDIVKLLLEHDADVHAQHDAAFRKLSSCGDPRIIHMIFAQRSSPIHTINVGI